MLRVLLGSFEEQDTESLSRIQMITSFEKLKENSVRTQIIRDIQQYKSK